MTKILFVSNTANFQKFNRPFMEWCTSQGWQVDYCSPDDEIVTECNRHYVIEIPRKPFSKDVFACIKELRKILIVNKYDIIHCHTPMGAAVARLAARKLFKKGKVKIIYTAHGFHFFKGAGLLPWLVYFPVEKILSNYTNVIITINHEDYITAKKYLNSKNLIEYMNGVGVDFEKFYPLHSQDDKLELRRRYKINEDSFVLLYTAEFIARKNHKFLFDSFDKIKTKIPRIKLILAGKGELLEYFKNESKLHGFENEIIFTGYTQNVSDYCRLSDCLISSSLQEGLPISMIEAIATGLPVVCSKIRGHVDVISEGENGFLFDIGDTDKMVNSIVRLYESKSLRDTIKNNNIKHSEQYGVKLAVNKMANIYNLIENKK